MLAPAPWPTYTSGSGTATLTFTYAVAAGQNTPTWTMPRPPPWRSMAAPSRTRRATRPCLTLPATGTDGLATQNIVIDTTPPTVTAVSSTQAAGAYAAGTTIPITVTFSEAVTVTGTPQLTLNDSGAVANYASGSGTATLTFTYVVAAGQNTPDLDYASTAALGAQRRQHPGRGGQRGRADPAGHGHRRPGDPEHRHRHDAADGDGGILDASRRGLRGGDDDPDHGHLQRSGDGDGHAATDAQRRAAAPWPITPAAAALRR